MEGLNPDGSWRFEANSQGSRCEDSKDALRDNKERLHLRELRNHARSCHNIAALGLSHRGMGNPAHGRKEPSLVLASEQLEIEGLLRFDDSLTESFAIFLRRYCRIDDCPEVRADDGEAQADKKKKEAEPDVRNANKFRDSVNVRHDERERRPEPGQQPLGEGWKCAAHTPRSCQKSMLCSHALIEVTPSFGHLGLGSKRRALT